MLPAAAPSLNRLSSCMQPTAKFSNVAEGERVSVSVTTVPLPKTKVELYNVKVHDDPEEHNVFGQSGDPHGTVRKEEDREGSKAWSHGSPPAKHGLQRRLDMPVTSK